MCLYVCVCMYMYVMCALYVSVCIRRRWGGWGGRDEGDGGGMGGVRVDSSVSYLSTEYDLQFQVR